MKGLLILLCLFIIAAYAVQKPNVLVVLLDQVGNEDVPFMGSGGKALVPTMSELASSGVILSNYYTEQSGIAARAALLTGRHPYRYGFQSPFFETNSSVGLSANEVLVPEVLSSLGYTTHFAGQWRLGYGQKAYLPEARGFKSSYGSYTWNGIDKFNHQTGAPPNVGVDWNLNGSPTTVDNSTYYTELIANHMSQIIEAHDTSSPLFYLATFGGERDCDLAGADCGSGYHQAPQSAIARYSGVSGIDKERLTYLASLTAIDDALAQVKASLIKKGMWDNTLVFLFSTSSGSVLHNQYAWPYRGSGGSVLEAGIRVPAFVSGPGLSKTGYKNGNMIHATDFYKTVISACNNSHVGYTPKYQDGWDQWEVISQNVTTRRHEIMISIDPVTPQVAFRLGGWKLVQGRSCLLNQTCGWSFPGGFQPSNLAIPGESTQWLFRVDADPSEQFNLWSYRPSIIAIIDQRINYYRNHAVSPLHGWGTSKCNPKGGVWVAGCDDPGY